MRADVDLPAKDDAGVKIVEKDGGPGVISFFSARRLLTAAISPGYFGFKGDD
jgi:hypothetical protein